MNIFIFKKTQKLFKLNKGLIQLNKKWLLKNIYVNPNQVNVYKNDLKKLLRYNLKNQQET
jgi:hypothetical protein